MKTSRVLPAIVVQSLQPPVSPVEGFMLAEDADWTVALPDTIGGMEPSRDVEFVFEPQVEGGYHAYAPELPGLHTEGDSLDEATANAEEALSLYVEGLRADGRSLDMGIVRLKLPLPA